jgi:transcriptional regulator with XRE-family HTH domain
MNQHAIIESTSGDELSKLGSLLKHAREAHSLTRSDLERSLGISQRTLFKMENGDGSVAAHSYARYAQQMQLGWLMDVFIPADTGPFQAHTLYITGTTALCMPGRNGFPALWYSETLKHPTSWRIAGRDVTSTLSLLGSIGLYDATGVINAHGVDLPSVWAANHERALFDLLIHYCVVQNKAIPNFKVSDIDDVVDLDMVQSWFSSLTAVISDAGQARVNAWLGDHF